MSEMLLKSFTPKSHNQFQFKSDSDVGYYVTHCRSYCSVKAVISATTMQQQEWQQQTLFSLYTHYCSRVWSPNGDDGPFPEIL